MELAKADNNPTVTSDYPIPNMYNSLSERLMETGIPGMCINDTTVPADNSLLSGQLIKSENSDLSENRNIHDPTEHSGLNKEDEKTNLMENQRNPIPQVNERIQSMPARTTSGDNRFFCDLCDKKFSKSSNLVRHKKSHAGRRFFVCDMCGKQISSSSDLAMHKRTHTGEKRFVCSICDKRFTSSSDLTKHRRVHTGERPFVCNTCEKRFTSSSDLTKHKRIHTGEKPFVCSFCDRRFARSSDLTKHRRTHSGEKPFVCNFCNKRFSCSNGLIQHKRSHAVENLISGLLLPVTPETYKVVIFSGPLWLD